MLDNNYGVCKCKDMIKECKSFWRLHTQQNNLYQLILNIV